MKEHALLVVAAATAGLMVAATPAGPTRRSSASIMKRAQQVSAR